MFITYHMEQVARSPQVLFPRRLAAWQRRGLSFRAAAVLSNAGCDTPEDVARLGRAYFQKQPNCAQKTLSELAAVGDWPENRITAVDAIAAALAMAIVEPEERHEVATDVMIALRRSGFVITASKVREAQ